LPEKKPEKDYCAECTVKGKCCQFGYIIDGKKYWAEPAIKCHWLTEDGRCAVYNDRKVLAPWCLSVEEYAKNDGAPKECGYHEVYDFKYPDGGIYDLQKHEEEGIKKALELVGQRVQDKTDEEEEYAPDLE
jgi:uncharacterized cysteine cluster protein YcgN (CxxCxxCC family)